MRFEYTARMIPGLAFAALTACAENCEVGTSWCEDDEVVVCVAEEDDWKMSDWEEDDDDSDGLVDFILMLFLIADAADGTTYVETIEDCTEYGLVCAEKTEDSSGETYAECDDPLGIGWMYD